MNITFFGHRDAPDSIRIILKNVLTELVQADEKMMFYIGTHGSFDGIVLSVLRELKREYENVDYVVVLSYMPTGQENYAAFETLLPESVAEAFPKYAITKRNMWMIDMSDTVITYVKHSYGGAAKYESIARSRGKRVIEISNLQE